MAKPWEQFQDEKGPWSQFQEQPKPVAPQSGALVSGFKSYLPQLQETYGGIKALLGVGAERALGRGTVSEALMRSGAESMAEAEKRMAPIATPERSSFTNALDKGIGSVLTEWLPYQAGSGAANLLESLGVMFAGGLAGTAVAPGAGTIGGAATGLVAKEMAKRGIKEATEKILKESGEEAAKSFLEREARKATVDVAKRVGGTAALGAQAGFYGTGQTAQRAFEEAERRGEAMSDIELSRVLPAAAVSTAAEFISDKIGLGAFKGLDKASQNYVGNIARNILVTGTKETPTEIVQSMAERFGAKLSLTDAAALKEYIDATAASYGMSTVPGTVGGVRGTMAAREQAKAEAERRAREPEVPPPAAPEVVTLPPTAKERIEEATGVTAPPAGVTPMTAEEAEAAGAAEQRATAERARIARLQEMAEADMAAQEERARREGIQPVVPPRAPTPERTVPPLAEREMPQATPMDELRAKQAEVDRRRLEAGLPTGESSMFPGFQPRPPLEGEAPTPAAPELVDERPMTERAAQNRLLVLKNLYKNSGRDPESIAIVPHPTVPDRFAIQSLDRPVELTPNLPETAAQREPSPKVLDPVEAYVNIQRRTNTDASRRFVQDWDAGKITRADVELALEQEKKAGQPPALTYTAEGEREIEPADQYKPRGERFVPPSPPPVTPPTVTEEEPPTEEPPGGEPPPPTVEPPKTVAELRQRLPVFSDNAKVRAANNNASFEDLANALSASSNPVTARVGELAKKISKEVRLLKPKRLNRAGTYAGVYNRMSDTVQMDPRYAGDEWTNTHEVVHALVARSQVNPTPRQRPIVKQLDDLYEFVLKETKRRGINPKTMYGLTNSREFASEAMSSSEFQFYLMGIPYKGKRSAWTEFTRLVANLLGIKDTNALTEAINLVDRIAQTKRAPYSSTMFGEVDFGPDRRPLLPDLTQTLFFPQTAQQRDQGYASRLKNPVTLKDGTRLSGFTDPVQQTTFYGYDKNGERLTVRREFVNPEDIVSSKDSNRTAEKLRQALKDAGEFEAMDFAEREEGEAPTLAAGAKPMDVVGFMGIKPQKQEESTVDRTKRFIKEFKEDPEFTKSSIGQALNEFKNKFENNVFSTDSAFNNKVRSELIKDIDQNKDVIGTLIEMSQSQTVHSDALGGVFIQMGGLRYDNDAKKWVGFEENNNFINLSRKIDDIAAKYNLSKEEAMRVAHANFIARRLRSLQDRNAEIETEIANLPKGDEKIAKLRESIVKIHLNDDQIQAGLDLSNMMPELNEVFDTWNGIRTNTVKLLVQSGMWSDETANAMLDVIDYVPFYREEQLEAGEGPKEFVRGLQVKAKEHRLKGSDNPVNDVFDNMVRWTQYAVNRSIRNHKSLQLIDQAVNIDVIDGKMAEQVKESGDNVVRVWRDGKQEFYKFADPLFADAFLPIQNVSIPSLKIFSWFANLLRQSVVLYPLFSVAQVPQDSFAAMFSSGLQPKFAFRIPFLAVKEFVQTIRKTSATHNELKKYGAVGVRDFTSTVIRDDAEIVAGLKKEEGWVKNAIAKLGHISMAADNAVRQAVYDAALQQGVSKAEALEKAFEIINFRRRPKSALLNIAGQTIPFFYAYLAAQRVAYNTVTGVGISPQERKAGLKTLAYTSSAVMALSFLYAMLNEDDEEYQDTPTALRDRTLTVPGTGGFRIPLRPDFFLFPKIVGEHLYHLITENGFSDSAKVRTSMKDAALGAILSPTPFPQAIKPVLEVGINYNFFTGRPLIGFFEQKKEAERQFNDSTSEFAKVIGSTGLISPIAVDHLVRGMFGSAGGLFLWGTNTMIQSDPNVERPELTFRDALAALPGTSGLLSKPSENALKSDFYLLRDEVEKAKNTFDDYKKYSPQGLEEYVNNEKAMARLAMAKQVEKISNELSKIRRSIKQINQMPSSMISADEKEQAIKELRQAERDMLKAAGVPEMRKAAQL
jgi:hypothetical protein